MRKCVLILAAAGILAGAIPPALARPAETCGLHRAEVVETSDPQGRDRLRVLAPSANADPLWAERVYPKKPLRAAAASPGDLIFILFEACDPARPVMIGFARS